MHEEDLLAYMYEPIGSAPAAEVPPREDAAMKQKRNAEDERVQSLLLSKLNSIVEGQQLEESIPDSIWNEWLWRCDPLQECHMDLLLNRMHLLGLLIARSVLHPTQYKP